MIIDELREKANRLPLLPGVYLMRDAEGTVIYVGKAKKLKNRVSSYFHGEHPPKVAAMVDHVADFEVVVVNSEFEALMLENSLIKRHMPHYNILLRDDKGYPFVRLDMREEYPRFSVVKAPKDDGAKYFGPFGGRGTTFDILATLQKALSLPTCSRRFPRDIGRERPCLNFQMGLCAGYCRPEADPAEYRRSMEQAAMVLSGRSAELKQALTEQMEQAAEELRFEQAALYRDRLRAVENLGNRQKVIATAFADTDAVGFFRGAKTCFAVLHYSEGSLAGKDFTIVDEPLETDGEAVERFLCQYYARRGGAAKTVLLPVEVEDAEALEKLLSEMAGRRVRVSTPQRGDRAALTETACLNAREEVQRALTAAQRRSKTLEWLQKALSLPTLPRRIEAFDISNTGSFGVVAAMTVFVDGKPLKRDYRKFKMKTVDGQDDYGSMHEAVLRRFARCVRRARARGAGAHAPGLRHGQGRPPPHPRARHLRRPRDRHRRQSGGVFLHRHHSGGDPPLRHRVPPFAALRDDRLHARQDPRRRRKAPAGAAEAFPQRRRGPRGKRGAARRRRSEKHRAGGL